MMQKQLTQNLLRLTDLLSESLGRSRKATLQRVAGKGGLLRRLEMDGCSFSVSSYDTIVQAYSNHWPAGLIWPADIDRPTPQLIGVGAAQSSVSARPEN